MFRSAASLSTPTSWVACAIARSRLLDGGGFFIKYLVRALARAWTVLSADARLARGLLP